VRTLTAGLADRILDTAARLFCERKFHEVRMDDIAAEAGVSKGTLYRYFHDKDDLYHKLLDRAAAEYAAHIRRVAEQAGSARAGLEAVAAAAIRYFDERPHLLELIQRGELERGPGPAFAWHGVRNEVLRLLIRLFTEGRERGEFFVADPELAALMLGGGLRALIRFGKRPRTADLARRAVAALVHEARAGA
jgi:TetR/AcrR family fatty acid metabolism transcriptional regulator